MFQNIKTQKTKRNKSKNNKKPAKIVKHMCYCGYLCNLTELRYTELFNQPLDWAHGQEGSGELTGGKTQKATQTYILKAVGLDHSAAGILYQSYLRLHVSCCCWAKASQTCMFYTFHKFYSTDYCTYFRAQAGIPMCWGGCLVIWGSPNIWGCTDAP